MPLLTTKTQEQIIDALVENGLLDGNLLQKANAQSEKDHNSLLSVLVTQGWLDEDSLAHAVSYIYNIPYINLENVKVGDDILKMLPVNIAKQTMAVPVGIIGRQLVVAMLDATNIQGVDFLSTSINMPILAYMTSQNGINNIIKQYGTDFSSVDIIHQQIGKENQEAAKETAISANLKTITQDSSISKVLLTLLEYAIRAKASDIHIEPIEMELIVRCRIDGILHEIIRLDKQAEAPLVSRVKILAGLKIDEHRIPQDGQFAVKILEKEVDLRIAISPVVWGEQIVIRLLDKTGNSFDLTEMGFAGRALRAIHSGMGKPNGMILTSGPTGSGKSTTLYALIKEIKGEEINIVTLEDPVEYKMDGVNQIQIDPEVGLTFASGLRSILRQDPDVVMVGEIRDKETANLAVQAALTGHLVLSTLHTNSAAGILPRLLDMGVEPFLLASTLNTVIGQRLVRRIAKDKTFYDSNEIETKLIKEVVGHMLPKSAEEQRRVSEDLGYTDLPLASVNNFKLAKGVDTQETPRGYKGRVGLYEVMDVDEDIQKLIISHATSHEIMRAAQDKGMISMREDGMFKALNGLTTIEEVNRVASDIA
ncbi:MAG: Flp pilus assembly complex ATPase component TadA [Candidatus Nomurabacteria bacterium]|jgi:type IV pilus assembly protein PilB|nr:Flp pilus assembly complex ATPase component TadA [Candidatus Nomurabacteria bacterium]